MTIKSLSYIKINGVSHLYFIIDKINGYIEESNGNIYLMLVPTDKSKDTLNIMKNYETKSKILLDQYLTTKTIVMKKYIKIKINSDDCFR